MLTGVCLGTTPFVNPPRASFEATEKDASFFELSKNEVYENGRKTIQTVERYSELELMPLSFTHHIISGRKSGPTDIFSLRYLILGSERIPDPKASDPNLMFQDTVHRDEIELRYRPATGSFEIYKWTTLHRPDAYRWLIEPDGRGQ